MTCGISAQFFFFWSPYFRKAPGLSVGRVVDSGVGKVVDSGVGKAVDSGVDVCPKLKIALQEIGVKSVTPMAQYILELSSVQGQLAPGVAPSSQ